MDPTEIFGLRIGRLAERWRARRLAPGATAVQGEPLLPRLKLLAGLVAGRPLEVRLAPGAGGAGGDTLLLPEWLDCCADPALNQSAYVYRVAYSATALGLGMAGNDAGPWADYCRSLLAVRATRRALVRALPGAAALADALHPAVLRNRPAVAVPRDAPSALETLCRILLGDDRDLVGAAPPAARRWLEQAVVLDACDASAIDALTVALFDALPVRRGLGASPVPVAVGLWGLPLALARMPAEHGAAPASTPARVTKEVDAQRRLGAVRRRAPRDRDRSPLFHHFEKIETLEDHSGDSTRADESGDPDAEREALDRMQPSQLVRSHEPSASCYRLDAVLEGTGLNVGGDECDTAMFRYPEWHHRRRRYREDWCALYEVRAAVADAEDRARAAAVLGARRQRIEDMRRRLEAALLAPVRRHRQRDGDEVDLDAAVDRHATLAAGHNPCERLYVDQRRQAADLAVWILLDQSLSSDSWVAGVRILDVEREAVLLLGEVLDGLLDEIGIACFSSNTRRCCRFIEIKGTGEPWAAARGRIMAVQPSGYTRIGPALRHAAARLRQVRARRRLLLLVTDGRPSDYDQYEGRYGIRDVAQAVREAHADGVRCHALAVERGAESRLVEMFGAGQFHVLHRPRLLPEAMSDILMRLRR
jgi:nitric oxide reductase activation protein